MGMMYLFDSMQRVRRALKDGVTKWRHKEQAYTLDAAILSEYDARPGEYLGFLCVDGKWRLFCIDKAEVDDDEGVTYITATDAAVDDLTSIVVPDKYQEDVTAKEAVEALLEGTGWSIGNAEENDKKENTDANYVMLWDALQAVQKAFEVRIVPYYVIADGTVKGKYVDVLVDEAIKRGRFVEAKTEASSVVVTYNQRPYTVLYGLGKSTGTGDEAEQVTFADIVWKKENGDPADKPEGQTWVEDTDASAKYGRRERIFVSSDTEDPEELLRLTWEALKDHSRPTVTVDAIIHDMEQIKGQKWKAIRLGDVVTVRTRRGEDVETRIVEIERDYLYPEQTRLIAGEEMPSVSKQVGNLVRAAIHTQETLTIHKNRFLQDEALIQLNAETILANADQILIHSKELLSIRTGVENNTVQITALDGKLLTQASELISLRAGVDDTAAQIILMDGRITANANAIELQAQDISLKADRIELQGLVTADQLAAVQASISNLTSGLTTAQVLNANIINGTNVNGTYGSFDALTHNGALVSQRSITMGSLTTAGKALSTGGEMDLQHSHAVTVNADGTITLGEVSSAGGSFKIADTKVYKDAVSAAAATVTLSAPNGWQGGRYVVEASNGKSLEVGLPAFSASGGDSFNASHKTTVYFYTDSVSGPLASKEVDASGVYSAGLGAGAATVTLSTDGWVSGYNVVKASNGESLTVGLPAFTVSGGNYFDTAHKTTVYFFTDGISTSLAKKEVDASGVYSNGVSAGASTVTLSSAGWVSGSNVVKASNGKSLEVKLPAFTVSGGEIFDTTHKTTVYFFTDGVTGSLAKKEVDATAVYNTGRNSVSLSKAWANGILTVSASNGKTKTAKLAKGTLTWDEAVASVPVLDESAPTGYTITVDASDRYNAGWNACREEAVSWKVLVNYYPAGETLYDVDGNVATGPWYKGTEANRYALPPAK